jgi:hypothetical protein
MLKSKVEVQLRGLTDSVSGPVVNPYMSVPPPAKTATGGESNSPINPAHGGLGRHRITQRTAFLHRRVACQ